MHDAIEPWNFFAALRHMGHAGWLRTRNLMLVMLGLWIGCFLVVYCSGAALNKATVPLLGFPVGFYLPVQGSVIVFVVTLYWFGGRAR
jgi:putative solute:sodium symporter small subunit